MEIIGRRMRRYGSPRILLCQWTLAADQHLALWFCHNYEECCYSRIFGRATDATVEGSYSNWIGHGSLVRGAPCMYSLYVETLICRVAVLKLLDASVSKLLHLQGFSMWRTNTSKVNRRNMLGVGLASMTLPGATILSLGCTPEHERGPDNSGALLDAPSHGHEESNSKGNVVKIQYLEIVTPDVDGACTLYSKMHGVNFGDADPNLGGARTANLKDGGMLAIRGPLRDTELPVVRPYLLVEDIKGAVATAAECGAEIAMPPTEIAGYGQFAIVIQGGIESGLWQL